MMFYTSPPKAKKSSLRVSSVVANSLRRIYPMEAPPTYQIAGQECCLCGAQAVAPDEKKAKTMKNYYCADCHCMSVALASSANKKNRFSNSSTAILIEMDGIVPTQIRSVTSKATPPIVGAKNAVVFHHGCEEYPHTPRYNLNQFVMEVVLNPPKGDYLVAVFAANDSKFKFQMSNEDTLFICGNDYEYTAQNVKKSGIYGKLPGLPTGNGSVVNMIPLTSIRRIINELTDAGLDTLLPYEWDCIIMNNDPSQSPFTAQKDFYSKIMDRKPEVFDWLLDGLEIPTINSVEHIFIREWLFKNWSLDKTAYPTNIISSTASDKKKSEKPVVATDDADADESDGDTQ